jgi:hypothetical protein
MIYIGKTQFISNSITAVNWLKWQCTVHTELHLFSNDKGGLSMPWRYTTVLEVQLHSFSTSVLDRRER